MSYREFKCIDCHTTVYSWSEDIRERCAVCIWIHNQPNLTEVEIEEIRVITNTPVLENNNE